MPYVVTARSIYGVCRPLLHCRHLNQSLFSVLLQGRLGASSPEPELVGDLVGDLVGRVGILVGDVRIDMCKDICAYIWTDMCTCMCGDMYSGMCSDMCMHACWHVKGHVHWQHIPQRHHACRKMSQTYNSSYFSNSFLRQPASKQFLRGIAA